MGVRRAGVRLVVGCAMLAHLCLIPARGVPSPLAHTFNKFPKCPISLMYIYIYELTPESYYGLRPD